MGRRWACALIWCAGLAWAWGTPLHEAVEAGSAASVQELLSATPALLDRPDARGRSPLTVAIEEGQRDIAVLLLEAGARVEGTGSWTPLHAAALAGDAAITELLLKKRANPNRREGQNGGTPLHVASFGGHLEVVRLLLRAGAKPNVRDREGFTPLFQAHDQGHPAVEKLLRAAGARR